MSFKEKYKLDNEKLVPDEAFLAQLSSKIEVAQANRKRSKIKILYTSVAAVLVIGVFGISLKALNSNKIKPASDSSSSTSDSSTGTFPNQGGNKDSLSSSSNLFSKQDKWYDEDKSDQENFDEFVLRLANTKDVKKVYSGSEEIFGDEDIIEPKEINKIFKKLKNAEITAEDYSEKSPLYYMVVFNNGEIVKFKIFDNQYVQFNDLTSSFTIK